MKWPHSPFLPAYVLILVVTSSYADTARFMFEKSWSPRSLNLADWNFRGGSKTSFGSISTIQDPFSTTNDTCYSIFYAKQSYGIESGKNSGVHVNCKPLEDQPANRAMLSYEIGFPPDFNWVKGGKLPGLFGGSTNTGCTGGREANGGNCFSMRLMWRAGGVGEVYVYLPKVLNDDLCARPDVTCNLEYGSSIGRNFKFKPGVWTKIELFVQLNMGNEQNGYLKLYVNNKLQVDLNKLTYRTYDDMYVDTFEFSSFFGGSTPNYATPVDTNIFIKNIQFQMDSGHLNNSFIALDSSSIAHVPIRITNIIFSATFVLLISRVLWQ